MSARHLSMVHTSLHSPPCFLHFLVARNGGGRSFQHLEAANLNDPRKAAVRWIGVRKTETGRPGHRHSCERICGLVSSRSTSTAACGTPRAPCEKAGGSSGSAAR
ncbi:hypothetical protein ABMA28_005978 [Loxostege sticticalis]|uniref:Uncharacterized protein n=1 Tax=Loxostege sticticalis TaxID=481309 RepID=A0ABD0SLZ2_LOXSC